MKTIAIELSDSDARLWHKTLVDAVNRRRTGGNKLRTARKLSKNADLNFVAEIALRYLIADELTLQTEEAEREL